MDSHILAGVVIAIVLLAGFVMVYESDLRARWERGQHRRRMRQRAKERDQLPK